MKEKIIDFFKQFTLFDIIYLAIALPATIVTSILCKSSALTIMYSIVGITSIFLLAKGFFFSPIFIILMYSLYVWLSYNNGLYGECIIYGAVFIPIQIITIISWFSKKKKEGNIFKIEKITLKEWIILIAVVIAIGVGVYFMLDAFNTKYLILSTLTFILSGTATYLTYRRTEYSFIVFLINNAFFTLLWLMPLLKGASAGIELIPMGVNSLAYFVLNLVGFINWRKMRKEQRVVSQNENLNKTNEE